MRRTGLPRCLLLCLSLGLAIAPACRDEAPGDERPDAEAPRCGNGVGEGVEPCDGADLRGQTCATVGAGAGDGLACANDCSFDTGACQTSGCGDDFCDPEAGEGQLTCPADCAWTTVSAGGRHNCGVRVDGTVWCWGRNHTGQLDGDPGLASAVPLRVAGMPPVARVAAGLAHSCALTVDGAMWCWGTNYRGQLGIGYGDAGASPPARVIGLGTVVSMAVGASYSCAVTDGAQAYCWGDNLHGQLGNDTPANVWIPSEVLHLEGAVNITAGGDDVCPFTCATTAQEVGLCWGCNLYGALGRGWPVSTASDQTPVAVDAQSAECESLTRILAGDRHACGRTPGGGLCCWGDNDAGQMGMDLPESPQPSALLLEVPVGTPVSWAAAGFGGRHGCAVLQSGSLRCWGANDFGQLGAEDAVTHPTPRVVAGFDGALAVDGGAEHTCVIAADGTLWCFGQNFFGQLGDSTTEDRPVPGPVAF